MRLVTPISQARDKRAYAKRYAALGWHVIPIFPIRNGACACDKPDCKSPGKHPIHQLAPRGQHSATTDVARVDQWWSKYPDANIAIYLAPSGLCAVDIDPRNGGAETIDDLEAQYGRLESDVMAFTGGGGEHRVFEAPASMHLPGGLGAGIDLKLDGYIVVEPSNHMSGGTYQWEGSSDPLEGAIPSPLPSWLRDLVARPAQARQAPVAAGSGMLRRELPPEELEQVRLALAQIDPDPRDNWVKVGMALNRDVVAPQAMKLWEEWSEQSDKFDIDDQMRVWYSFRRNSLENSLGLGTLFEMAGERVKAIENRSNPQVKTIGAYTSEEMDEFGAMALAKISEKPAVAIRPFPVESLNELTAWVAASNEMSHPLANQAIALAIVCAAASRRYQTPSGDPLHAFFGVILPSVSMGRYLTKSTEILATHAGMSDMLRASRFTSPQQLYAGLFKSPSLLYCAEDWADQLRFARRQPSGLLEQTHTIIGNRVFPGADILLTEWAELGFKPDRLEARTKPAIYRPSMTLLAPLAHSQLGNVFRSAEMARGAADAMVFIPTDDDRWINRPTAGITPPPEHVRVQFRALRGLAEDQTALNEPDLLSSLALQMPTVVTVRFNADLQSLERAWIDRTAKAPSLFKPMIHGARQNVRRLAGAIAAWQGPAAPVVTDEILSWVNAFVSGCLDQAISEIQTTGVDDESRPDAYELVADAISRNGRFGMKKRDLPKYCRAFRKLDNEHREKLIGQMMIDAVIFEFATSGGKGRIYVHQRFVELPASELQGETAVVNGSQSASTTQTRASAGFEAKGRQVDAKCSISEKPVDNPVGKGI